MDKVKEHLKNNFAIYVVLVTCLVVIGIVIGITSKPKLATADTTMFEEVTLTEALELFNTNDAKLLVMSVETCTATIDYVPYLQIAQAKGRYTTYYLDLNSIDTTTEEFKLFQEKLNLEYSFYGNVDKFSAFMSNTPQTVIIKNKEQVYGHIGSISTNTLETLTKMYGVAK